MGDTIDYGNTEILEIADGLAALDGVSSEAGKIVRFKFKPGVVWDVAKDRRIFDHAAETVQKAFKSLAAQSGIVEGMKVTPENAAAVAKFVADKEEILARRQELAGVLKINLADLQENENQIPPGVLAHLFPILREK